MQDGVTAFLATMPSFVFRNKSSRSSLGCLEPQRSSGCRLHGSLSEGGLTWNTDASLAPPKNENQTAATMQGNSFSVCYGYHT